MMRKVSKITEEKHIYDVVAIIDNTALVKSIDGKKGLINISTNEVVGAFGKYTTKILKNGGLFIQSRKTENSIGEATVFIRIYDAKNEKMIVEDYILSKELNSHLFALQDPNTQKYHLFDREIYRNSPSISEVEYDSIDILNSNYANEWLLTLTKDSKKAIYSTKNGLITSFEYDEIEHYSNVTIFTQGNKKFFTFAKSSAPSVFVKKSPTFDDITHDNTISPLLYCKTKDSITVYYVSEWKYLELFILPLYDEIKKTHEYSNHTRPNVNGTEYTFLVKQNNKYGLISGYFSDEKDGTPILRNLVDVEYDKIEHRDGIYFIYKGNKVGLFDKEYKKNYSLDAIYDSITPIKYTYYFIVSIGEKYSIVNLVNGNVVISDCDNVIDYRGNIIYEKKGKKGIVSGLSSSDGYQIIDDFDDIKYLGTGYSHNYYLITKNGLYGILYNNKLLCEPKYESIEINGKREDNYHNIFIADVLYFTLKRIDGGYDLAKFNNSGLIGLGDSKKLTYLNSDGFEDIRLYNSVMAFKDTKQTYIYNYNKKLLKVLPKNVQINETTIKIGDEERELYRIDGIYYIHKDDKFEAVPIETIKLFVTAYESEYGTVVVNSYDEKEHNKVCNSIESIDEESFDNTLNRYYENNHDIQEKYPTLVKKINKK